MDIKEVMLICPVQCKFVPSFCVKHFELSHVMDIAL